MRYRVKLEKTDEGYAVWCPGLPGCWSQGATEEEALENIKDAIETYLATVEELTKVRAIHRDRSVHFAIGQGIVYYANKNLAY
jgi:predicted RNase H-like HicB family nuclease